MLTVTLIKSLFLIHRENKLLILFFFFLQDFVTVLIPKFTEL